MFDEKRWWGDFEHLKIGNTDRCAMQILHFQQIKVSGLGQNFMHAITYSYFQNNQDIESTCLYGKVG